MGQRVRVVVTVFMVASAIVLAGCGADTSATASRTDAQRNAGPFKDTTLCVTGQTGSPMTVYLSKIVYSTTKTWEVHTRDDPKETGPFPLIENSCFTNADEVHATVYNSDDTRAFSIVAGNPSIAEPFVYVICRIGSVTSQRYEFSEGLQRSYECGPFGINIERMTDSETEKRLQANVGLR